MILRRTTVAVVALLALTVGMAAWAGDESFSYVVDDQADLVDGYRWLDVIPESATADIDQLDTGTELTRLSTPTQRLITFTSRSCPPLLEISTDAGGAEVWVTARDPRVDWRCGGYAQTYVLQLTLRDGARPTVLIQDSQTSPSIPRP